MNNAAPRPMPFAIMRNAHEALRSSIRLQEKFLQSGDLAKFRAEWRAYVRARAVHMAMEDDAMFDLLDGVSNGAISSSGLPEEHDEIRRLTQALEANLASENAEGLRTQWATWRDSQLRHMEHEEQVMNPLVRHTADTPAGIARVVHERLINPCEDLPDFDWYIGWVVGMLSDHGSTEQPPNVATRVFAWALQHVCSPAQWSRLCPIVEKNCPPEIWSEMTSGFGLDDPGKIT
jgi:hemerythrin-like domain-containing protein